MMTKYVGTRRWSVHVAVWTVLAVAALPVFSAPVFAATPSPTTSGQGAAVTVSPAEVSLDCGQLKQVDILISNAKDLYGVDLEISFDPDVLEVVDADSTADGVQIKPGALPDVSRSQGLVQTNEIDAATGTINYTAARLEPAKAQGGNGIIVSIPFKGKATGSSPIRLDSVTLTDSTVRPIAVTKKGGRASVACQGDRSAARAAGSGTPAAGTPSADKPNATRPPAGVAKPGEPAGTETGEPADSEAGEPADSEAGKPCEPSATEPCEPSDTEAGEPCEPSATEPCEASGTEATGPMDAEPGMAPGGEMVPPPGPGWMPPGRQGGAPGRDGYPYPGTPKRGYPYPYPDDGPPHKDGWGCVHRVVLGETLDSIAWRYGVSTRALADANGIWNPNYIRAGQVLTIPGCGGGYGHGGYGHGGYPPPATGGCFEHVIWRGDTLWNIAWAYGDSVDALAYRNGIINPHLIYAGQAVTVCPGGWGGVGDTYHGRWGGAGVPYPGSWEAYPGRWGGAGGMAYRGDWGGADRADRGSAERADWDVNQRGGWDDQRGGWDDQRGMGDHGGMDDQHDMGNRDGMDDHGGVGDQHGMGDHGGMDDQDGGRDDEDDMGYPPHAGESPAGEDNR